MDVLSHTLRILREQIEATGAPPDWLQDKLAETEHIVRRGFGGSVHHISRLPQVSTKARILELAAGDLTAQQISARLDVTDRYVRMVLATVREASGG